MNNKIRLNESQLRNIIRESVKRILNEVKVGGKSLHGTNPLDWATIGHYRTFDAMDPFEHNVDIPYDKYSYKMDAGCRDLENAFNMSGREYYGDDWDNDKYDWANDKYPDNYDDWYWNYNKAIDKNGEKGAAEIYNDLHKGSQWKFKID